MRDAPRLPARPAIRVGRMPQIRHAGFRVQEMVGCRACASLRRGLVGVGPRWSVLGPSMHRGPQAALIAHLLRGG
ncbi:hypothetical protein HMPREF1549_00136 [Actinomyces johnsonii F0510]|uniref:Uncharacterized protein n=1 Tax=Actinomyces johnsonii F0510 TaxID=1227262 RepID=U1RYS3_9ACTO|nr:hypothetical protein HMPREF1549_00136 [Actinomyces johnsonii F0510]